VLYLDAALDSAEFFSSGEEVNNKNKDAMVNAFKTSLRILQTGFLKN